MMDWMARLLGLSDSFLTSLKTGGGLILGSASESALTAAMAARERALRLLTQELDPARSQAIRGSDVPVSVRDQYGQKLVMYGSTQTHSLGAKAALLLGLQFRAIPVAEADGYTLRGENLRKGIEMDIAAGFIPFFVIASVGTTSSGAIDRIGEIGEVLKSYPTAFLHIDAAWAGVAYALPAHREELRLAELNNYADSICTNAHKWGLIGFDCSLFFIRNRTDLTEAFDVTPAFLRSKEGDSGAVVDYRNWQIALGRRFRSVKLWFVLRSYGADGFRKHLQRGIDHCQQLAAIVKASRGFELVTTPSLALLVFRLKPEPGDFQDEVLNLLNQRLNDRLVARYDVFVTQTVLHSVEREIFCIRFSMGGLNTTMNDVMTTWRVIEAQGEEVLSEWEKDRSL